MNSKMNRLLTSLVLGLGLTFGLLKVLNNPSTRPLVAHAADRHVCLNGCPYDSIQAADANDGDSGSNSQPAPVIVKQGQLQDLSNPIAENSITIDNTREGWESAIPYTSDSSGEEGLGVGDIDWITITMAHDCDELYIRYEVDDGPPFDPDNAWKYSVFVDVDRDRNTGFIGLYGELSIGADVLFQGRREEDCMTVKAGVFKYIGSGTDWNWSLISDNPVDDQVPSGTKRDIEWKTLISNLDVFGAGVTSFNWVATQESGINDFYPNGGNGGAAGDFYTYTLSFPNPERGFYHATETHPDNYTPLVSATLQGYRENEGITLIHRMFYLENFVTSTISVAYTTAMQADFDAVREAGLKAIVRFAYTDGLDLEPPYGDASKEWILTHTNQLSDVLHANSDVIAVMQAGFIGLWGEWWYSDHFVPDGDWNDRCEVLFAILDTLPTTRMVQLRTPRYKYNIYSDTVIYSGTIPFPTPLAITQAHDGSNIARTGHHNDCFVSSASDYGTYVYTPTEYPYLEEDTKWVVMGGETCIPYFPKVFLPIVAKFHQEGSSSWIERVLPTGNSNPQEGPASTLLLWECPVPGNLNPDRLRCETVLDELAKFHWSYLNIDWYEPTLREWRDDGCFPEIEQRLGYRFALTTPVTFPDQVRCGDAFTFSLQLENEGFAAPFNPRAVELILRHTNGSTYTVELPDDPRFWLPDGTHTISHTISIPCSLPTGSYELLLNLPDPAPRLRHRPEYAIRLARSTWETATGYNKLNHTLVVTP